MSYSISDDKLHLYETNFHRASDALHHCVQILLHLELVKTEKRIADKSRSVAVNAAVRKLIEYTDRVNDALQDVPSGYKKPYRISQYYSITGLALEGHELDGFFDYIEVTNSKQLIETRRVMRIVDDFKEKIKLHSISVPQQENSLKLRLHDGKVALLEADALDNKGNDIEQLEALHPPLKEALNTATTQLNSGNMAYGFLADILDKYTVTIDKPLATINYGEVFARGNQIEKGLALAKTYHSSGEYAALPPTAQIMIESVLEIHKPFLAATNLGADIVASSEFYEKSPGELKQLREDIKDLRELVQNSHSVIEQETAELIDLALDIPDGKQNAKRSIFAMRVAKNFGIVTVSGAVVSGFGIAALAIPAIGPIVGVGTVLASGIGAVGSVAISKSEPMKELAGDVRHISKQSYKASITKLSHFKSFVIQNAKLLKRTSTLNDKGEWFEKTLNVLRGTKRIMPIEPYNEILSPDTIIAKASFRNMMEKASRDMEIFDFNKDKTPEYLSDLNNKINKTQYRLISPGDFLTYFKNIISINHIPPDFLSRLDEANPQIIIVTAADGRPYVTNMTLDEVQEVEDKFRLECAEFIYEEVMQETHDGPYYKERALLERRNFEYQFVCNSFADLKPLFRQLYGREITSKIYSSGSS